MSTNQVPDIGEMYKFWELKQEIYGWLTCLHAHLVVRSTSERDFLEDITEVNRLKHRIESLGKKETNDKR
jgi:hypothetical protein